MAEFETEEQQVEALKQWWADNGRAVLLGIGIGLAMIFGGSPYAAMASLAEARFQVENDNLPEAESALRWAADEGTFGEIVPVAQLRLARVLKAQGKYPEALKALDRVSSPAFTGHVEEIRGDIYLDQGDAAQAASAYQRARDSGSPTNSGAALQMKIDDLATNDTTDELVPGNHEPNRQASPISQAPAPGRSSGLRMQVIEVIVRQRCCHLLFLTTQFLPSIPKASSVHLTAKPETLTGQ